MPLIEVDLTDDEIRALTNTHNPSPEQVADAIRRRVLSTIETHEDEQTEEEVCG